MPMNRSVTRLIKKGYDAEQARVLAGQSLQSSFQSASLPRESDR